MAAALAEYPERIKRIFLQRSRSPYHAYCVALCIGGEFREIFLDDTYYTADYNEEKDFYPPAFCSNNDEVIWGHLIEKTYSKIYGSYGGIEFGYGDFAFFDLTGAPSECITFRNYTKLELDDMYEKLERFHKQRFSMVCGSKGKGEKNIGKGIISGHA